MNDAGEVEERVLYEGILARVMLVPHRILYFPSNHGCTAG